MFTKAFFATVAVIGAYLINTAAALAAQGTSPDQVAENAKGMFASPAKTIWWIFAVIIVFRLAASRNKSQAAGFLGFLALAGIAVFNPEGTENFMRGVSFGIF